MTDSRTSPSPTASGSCWEASCRDQLNLCNPRLDISSLVKWFSWSIIWGLFRARQLKFQIVANQKDFSLFSNRKSKLLSLTFWMMYDFLHYYFKGQKIFFWNGKSKLLILFGKEQKMFFLKFVSFTLKNIIFSKKDSKRNNEH